MCVKGQWFSQSFIHASSSAEVTLLESGSEQVAELYETGKKIKRSGRKPPLHQWGCLSSHWRWKRDEIRRYWRKTCTRQPGSCTRDVPTRTQESEGSGVAVSVSPSQCHWATLGRSQTHERHLIKRLPHPPQNSPSCHWSKLFIRDIWVLSVVIIIKKGQTHKCLIMNPLTVSARKAFVIIRILWKNDRKQSFERNCIFVVLP